jgi:hypothetical protein
MLVLAMWLRTLPPGKYSEMIKMRWRGLPPFPIAPGGEEGAAKGISGSS